MATINGREFTGFSGINLKTRNGALRFETPETTPTTTSGERLIYVNSSNQLIFDNGSSTTVLGAGGGGSTPTWETIFVADNTFYITPDITFTIAGNRATATDVLTITNAAGGSGSCIQITNSGSGHDIDGTSDTWSVSKAGAAVFVGVTPGGDVTSTSTAIDWDLKDNDSSALSFDAGGAAGLIEIVTTNGAEVVKFGKNIQVTDGIGTFISTSNTVSNVLVTNNTITTFGADANSTGAVCLRSTSMTTGSLLQLQLADDQLAGGFYLTCRESVGGTNDLTIGENGVLAMAGTAGSDSLTVTAGDVVVGDGSIALTDADNAASFSVTNNTATTASVAVLAGSGAFTGNTTSSFLTLTPSGLTTGTAFYLPVAALTTGKAIDIVGNAMTSGILVNVSSSAALTQLTGAGRLLKVDHTGNATGSGIVAEIASAAADETVIFKVTASAALAAGIAVDLSAAALTTGKVIDISDLDAITTGKALHVDATGVTQTDGILVHIDSASTALTATGRLLLVDHTGNAGVSNVNSEFLSAAADETVILQAKASAALALGKVVNVSGAAVTTGTLLDLSDNTAHTTGTALNVVTNSANTGTRTLVNIKQDHASASGATPLTIVNDNATNPLIAGTAAATTTNYFKIMTANSVTLWMGNGTTANGNLSGTAGDILFNGGSNKPEYCSVTGTTWVALV